MQGLGRRAAPASTDRHQPTLSCMMHECQRGLIFSWAVKCCRPLLCTPPPAHLAATSAEPGQGATAVCMHRVRADSTRWSKVPQSPSAQLPLFATIPEMYQDSDSQVIDSRHTHLNMNHSTTINMGWRNTHHGFMRRCLTCSARSACRLGTPRAAPLEFCPRAGAAPTRPGSALPKSC